MVIDLIVFTITIRLVFISKSTFLLGAGQLIVRFFIVYYRKIVEYLAQADLPQPSVPTKPIFFSELAI